MKKSLTALALAALRSKDRPYYISDAKQDGLRVRVSATGGLTWNVTCRIKGSGLKSVSLGRCDPNGRDGLDIAGARDRAAAILKAAREGRNLLGEEHVARQEAKDAFTIAGLIDSYGKEIASPRRKGGPLRTAADIKRRLERALSAKLTVAVDGLRRADISRLLEVVAETYPREAEKRRQTIHAMFNWAVAKGYATENPVAGMPGYSAGETRDRVLSADEVRAFWQWMDAGAENMPPDPIAALRLQLLIGARGGEVAGMTSDEVEERGDDLVWTLPAARSKNKSHRVTPLVGMARAIVEGAIKARPSGALFKTVDGSRALTSSDVGQALINRREKLPIAHFTTHDLRRTVVSGMDELDIPLE